MRACKVRRNAPERRPVTKFPTKRDRQVLQSPRAFGPEKTPQAQGFTEGVILRGRRDVSPRQDAMKEVCSLRRGWAGGSASLSSPDPYHRGVRQRSPGRAPLLGSPHPYPTICRLWVACSSSSSQVARRLPGSHSSVAASPLRCQSGLSVGRSTSGRPPPWCPQGGLLPAGTCWTLWQTGGDCNAIAGA